jgi:hypothetical protein
MFGIESHYATAHAAPSSFHDYFPADLGRASKILLCILGRITRFDVDTETSRIAQKK